MSSLCSVIFYTVNKQTLTQLTGETGHALIADEADRLLCGCFVAVSINREMRNLIQSLQNNNHQVKMESSRYKRRLKEAQAEVAKVPGCVHFCAPCCMPLYNGPRASPTATPSVVIQLRASSVTLLLCSDFAFSLSFLIVIQLYGSCLVGDCIGMHVGMHRRAF